jgi:hypothetical protein
VFEFKMISLIFFKRINDKLYSSILIFHKNFGKAAALTDDPLLMKSCALHVRLPP